MSNMKPVVLLVALTTTLCLLPNAAQAQLQQNYYAAVCPNVESIVRGVVNTKFQQTFVTIPATLRLFFHDCFVNGCDASVMIASTGGNTAEKDSPDNQSLAGDGFDTVIKAKAAVDAVPGCQNKVSCADILAMAARDVIALSGGPSYAVELGRLDGLSSTAASVNGKLPQPTDNLNQLNSLFASNGLSQTDMIALSGYAWWSRSQAGNTQMAERTPLIWNWRIPCKIKIFLWLALQERLLTMDYRAKWRPKASQTCVLCQTEVETVLHLFITCPVTTAFWDELSRTTGMPLQFQDVTALWCVMSSITSKGDKSIQGRIHQQVISAGLWALWTTRNSVLFRHQRFYVENL
ncbi:Peroxidase 50 [Acorus calamus]|uniref:Peroxidase n=1 Tax=Acorus calamus TaxID=4465 RepID=A0AAV9EYZ1_ACOCL|nr:Peroxidase 50 [Acorus calamus]